MRRLATLAPLALGLILPLAAPAVAATDSYGPWILSCTADPMTDKASCRMVHETPVEPAGNGQGALALEVSPRRGRLVPVVTARELGIDNPARGLLALTGTVQMRFPPNPLFEMPCALEGRSVVCAPRPDDLPRAAAELAKADRVLVRVMGLGAATAEAPPRELRLAETAPALAAFAARVPPEQGGEPPPPFDLRELIGRVQRFFLKSE
ncbi:hypothetical protein [Roseomonas sp. 18066]|uniref:hypothetical protein n=1 Tax=Roseomonas sp. 18066 TaxID=2681412 RepID=UPI0013581B82|nr:hypothetical protein [Roseomonas sp. 18066]